MGIFFLSYKKKKNPILFIYEKLYPCWPTHYLLNILKSFKKNMGKSIFLPFKFMTDLILDKIQNDLRNMKFELSGSLSWEQGESYLWIHLPRGKNLNSDTCPTAGSYYAVSAHEVYSSRLQADISPKTWKTLGPTDL